MTATRSTTMKVLGLGLILATKKTRKAKFLDEMERLVPMSALVQIVEPRCRVPGPAARLWRQSCTRR